MQEMCVKLRTHQILLSETRRVVSNGSLIFMCMVLICFLPMKQFDHWPSPIVTVLFC